MTRHSGKLDDLALSKQGSALVRPKLPVGVTLKGFRIIQFCIPSQLY